MFNVISRQADIVIGGLNWQSKQSKNLMNSQAYFQDDITWCVPKPKLRAVWENFFYIADAKVISCGMAAILPTIGIAYALSAYERRPLDIWESILICTQGLIALPLAYIPERIVSRLYFVFNVQLGFLLVSIFGAYMFTIMTQPNYVHQISTFVQITDANYRLRAEVETRNYLTERNMVNDSFFTSATSLTYRILFRTVNERTN